MDQFVQTDSVQVEHVTIAVTVLLLLMIVGTSVALVVRRVLLARSERTEQAMIEAYREDVLEFVGMPDAEPSDALLTASTLEARAAIAELLSSYGRLLRGEATDRILDFLERGGYVDAALHDLESRRAWRRGSAARTLGQFGSSRAVQNLALVMIRDRSENVRITAARALGRIDDYKAAAALLMVLPMGRVPKGVVAQSLHRLGTHSFRALIDACMDDTLLIRRVATELVGLMGDGMSAEARERVLEVLTERVASDNDAVVRTNAARAIGTIGDTSSIAAIAGALLDPDEDVCEAACDTARQLHAHEVAPQLRQLLQRQSLAELPNPSLARAAARALVALTPAEDDGDVAASPFVIESRAVARIQGRAAS